MRIYLDTNIIISGHKDEEIGKIKTNADSQGYTFVYSQTARSEQKKRSIDHYGGALQKSAEWYKFAREIINDEIIVNKAREEYSENSDKLDQLGQVEKDEWSFWKGSKFDIPRCTFEGLLTMAQVFTDLERFDTKGEIRQLTALMEEYGLKGNDALHAMEAHSEGSDYFLSNDKKLINKLKVVKWLNTRPVTPKELLDILRIK